MDEKFIKFALFQEFSPTNILIPNVYWYGRNESDILRITKSYYVHEYEVKTSRQDFLNEKRKRGKQLKHKAYMHEGTVYNELRKPNYFSFVCPEDLISEEDVNSINIHYGLFYVMPQYYGVSKIKAPKRLHPKKFDPKNFEAMSRRLMFKLFTHYYTRK